MIDSLEKIKTVIAEHEKDCKRAELLFCYLIVNHYPQHRNATIKLLGRSDRTIRKRSQKCKELLHEGDKDTIVRIKKICKELGIKNEYKQRNTEQEPLKTKRMPTIAESVFGISYTKEDEIKIARAIKNSSSVFRYNDCSTNTYKG